MNLQSVQFARVYSNAASSYASADAVQKVDERLQNSWRRFERVMQPAGREALTI